ncbi:cysteine desulfurase family protein [Vallitalea okinawensis]|uniref:cysteine desulfurase family protein n=1 Tax=Vallitalea okinawensis TaxID=2078660 RepID=UPI000CFADA0B|nr:cysteine desulfurase family protein [Vallitalea okinawensis]
MSEIYFDNGATTKPSDGVIKAMVRTLTEDYGNPSSLHHKGMKAEDYIKEAAENISKALGVEHSTIYFTSGGTESNNLAIKGVAEAYKRRGKHIIATKMEHKSVASPITYLRENYDYEITYLSINETGQINIEELRDAIREDTVLVTIMHVNNEIGAIQNLNEIGLCIKEKNANTLFHVDAIQSFGKLKINPKKSMIDLLSLSGHKFHGPKGAGALYMDKKVRLVSLFHGGGHQRGMRSGTENVSGIAGLGQATVEAMNQIQENMEHMKAIKTYFYDQLIDQIEGAHLNGPSVKDGAPHILSIRFDDVRGEVLLHSLESDNIYVSTGSACSSNRPEEKSPTLAGIGLGRKEIDETIRFSFSKFNTKEEADKVIVTLKALIPRLRMFTRK